MQDMKLFPEQASVLAGRVDLLFFVLVAISLTMALLLTVLVLSFAIRYRRGARVDRALRRTGSGVEYFWMGGLLVVFSGLFVWAARLYVEEMHPPATALEILGLGKQWMWEFQHPTGQKEINELHVPLGTPVKLTLATADVIHSFYVPAFRIKQDVVPGRYNVTWFDATRLGRFHLFCAEYCGLNHARMGGWVTVMEPAQYQGWLSGRSGGASPAVQGEQLFHSYGCAGCHGSANRMLAPSLAGVFESRVRLQNGQTVIADETYLRDSILSPGKQVVAGFAPVMPSFAGRISEVELIQIIAYIKSLSKAEPKP